MLVLPPDRRQFLKLLSGATAALCTARWSQASESLQSDVVRLSIIHTTDLHGHILPTVDYDGHSGLGGLARCATQIAAWRGENPNSILIDVGDVYEGTQFGFGDQGRAMIELFNLLRYDAWIIGNHEFDWSIEPFLQAVSRSAMPVLAANTTLAGKPAGCFEERNHPFARIQPFLLREIAGVRLAIVGLTTPGMPFWFPPGFTEGIEFLDPIEPTRRAIQQARSLGAHAIILAGHMGLKERTGGDDFANRAISLTAEFPEATVFIAGHTHQPIESRLTNGTIFTQADHFGIHIGRIDLLFDRNSKKLLHQEAHTELLDNHIETDPVILSRAKPQLDAAANILSQPVGELAETLSARDRPGEPSQIALLIAAAITEAFAGRGLTIDGVFHGLFDGRPFHKGQKTIGDIWQILPYENFLVTAELDSLSLKVMMQETFEVQEARSLAGFRFEVEGDQRSRSLTNLRRADGRPLDLDRRYRVALNTFDASSAGHRFMKLREMLGRPESGMTLHPIQTREALIGYFRYHRIVRRSLIEPSRASAA
ncbi:MAG TPA: bifunctional UDP-sugar hydrolase/5'-nucleotidase [Chthoniobacterales bacterium]|nr:bifunctional UDP-sugar hydrolase/5'-nucleotidase [Chthoniobacterales bacterium]